MESVHVEEIMMRNPDTVPTNLPVPLLANEFIRTGQHGFPVVNGDGSLYGIVSLEDYRKATSGGGSVSSKDDLAVRDIATRDVVTVFLDETVGTALRRMAPRDFSRIPVVARDNALRILGVVTRNDVVRAYEVGVLRREDARRRTEATQAVNNARAEFIDMPIPLDASTIGKTVAELNIPRTAVLVSIRRGRELVIPHGDTRLQDGDVVTALCQRGCVDEVKAALNPVKDKSTGYSA
jgi:CIC family chloride channel protein